MTTPAQRAAQARYDKNRGGPIPVRLNAAQIEALTAGQLPGESRQHALMRMGPDLLGLAATVRRNF